MTIWEPDTCNCLIEYDDNVKLIKFIKKCKLHENKTFDDVLAHNRSFNMALDKTDDEKSELKAIEKAKCDK